MNSDSRGLVEKITKSFKQRKGKGAKETFQSIESVPFSSLETP